MPGNHNEIEKRLWDAADELRANSALKSSEYSVPVLGLIFLRYADHKFSQVEKDLAEKNTGRRKVGKTDYQARGVNPIAHDPAGAQKTKDRLSRQRKGRKIQKVRNSPEAMKTSMSRGKGDIKKDCLACRV